MDLFDKIVSGKASLTSKNSTPQKQSNTIVTLLDGRKVKKNDVPVGEIYINENGQKSQKLIKQPVCIETTSQMKGWLNQLAPFASPALTMAIDNQMQVLNNVFSASLAGMAIDNMLFSLQRSLQLSHNEQEKENMRDNFCMMIQNFVFINEAKLLYAREENRMEAASLLGQAGSKMMSCAVNIGMQCISAQQMSKMAEVAASGAKMATNTLAKKITTSDIPPMVTNPFEGPEGEKMLNDLVKNLAKKKILIEKQQEFDKMMLNLFPTFDRYTEIIGPSVLVTGLLERYVNQLMEKFETKRYTSVISRVKMFQPPKKFLAKAAPSDYEYVRALEIEINAEASAAKRGLELEREELEEYKKELNNTGIFKRNRRDELIEKIKNQEAELKRQRDSAEIAETMRFKLEQILEPVKKDVENYRAELMRVVEKYDYKNHKK